MKLNVAVQMDPIARIKIRAIRPLRCCWRRRGAAIGCSTTRPTGSRCATSEVIAPVRAADRARRGRRPFHAWASRARVARRLRRGAAAAGPALRPRLYHHDAPARAHPSEDAGGERSRPRAQRAGKALRDGVPAPDAADADLARPRRDRGVPRRAWRRGDEAAATAMAARRCFASAARTRISARSSTCSP